MVLCHPYIDNTSKIHDYLSHKQLSLTLSPEPSSCLSPAIRYLRTPFTIYYKYGLLSYSL